MDQRSFLLSYILLILDYKYNIRVIPGDVFFGNDSDNFEKIENGKIIASYNSLEELVNDGWELD